VRILLFGAGGVIGSAIALEAIRRGHEVTGACPSGLIPDGVEGMSVMVGDATDPASVAALAPGHDAVVSAIGPRRGTDDDVAILLDAVSALVHGLRKAGVYRLIIVGHAGSLFVAPGRQLLNQAEFPPESRPIAMAHSQVQAYLEWADDLDWTYLCPPASLEPGDRVGHYRVGGERLLVDAAGVSRITIPDFAAAFADELEQPRGVRRCVTVAY
jgi:putative NADH-flavin reductase